MRPLRSQRIGSYLAALAFLKLPWQTKSDAAYSEYRRQMVMAVRSADDERQRVLSQCRQKIKRHTPKWCEWPGCVTAISRDAHRCLVHRDYTLAFREHCVVKVEPPILEDGIPIPPVHKFIIIPMRHKLRVLKQDGRVGQSFVEYDRRDSGISHIGQLAKQEGVQVIARRVFPEQLHAQKKGWCLFRVWRTDGLSAVEINGKLAANGQPEPKR